MTNRWLIGLLFCFWFFALPCTIHSQTFFNVLPDVGGVDMNGVCRISTFLEDSFHVIGHRYDTIGEGSNVKPWGGMFNYSGELSNVYPIIDNEYSEPFDADILFKAEKNDSISFILARRNIQGPYFTPYLFELNVHTGVVLNSVLLPIPEFSDKKSGIAGIEIGKNIISILTFVDVNDSKLLYVSQLDFDLNLIETFQIKQSNVNLYPLYFNVVDNIFFECIGNVLVTDSSSGKQFNDTYIVKFNKQTNEVLAKRIPSEYYYSFSTAASFTTYKTTNNDWIIGLDRVVDKSDSCQNCFVSIPYIVALSENFDSILWETRFYDIPFHYSKVHFLHSITAVEDGYIVSGNFESSGNSETPASGILLKASLNGDSLWMKHFIPIDWDDERVAWARLRDISTTPFGSVIALGEVWDKDLDALRPWILHLDADGCLLVDCNLVANKSVSSNSASIFRFKVFPNPAFEKLYFSCSLESDKNLSINLYTIDGKKIKSKSLSCRSDILYMISLNNIPSGQYVISFKDEDDVLLESRLLLIQ